MMSTAWELQIEALPAEHKHDAILEIFISSGKLKVVGCGRVPSGGAS